MVKNLSLKALLKIVLAIIPQNLFSRKLFFQYYIPVLSIEYSQAETKVLK